MKKIVIDGLFLTQPINGINRYSVETILALDEMAIDNYDIILVIPIGIKLKINLQNIKLVQLFHSNIILDGEKKIYKGWTRKTAEKYAINEEAYFINFSGYAPRKAKGVCVLHDIRPIDYKNNYEIKQIKFKIVFILNCLIAKIRKLYIITDSEYSKYRINKRLKIKNELILVGYCGWEHIKKITENDNIFYTFPFLQNKKYCFALGSMAPHKNYKWIYNIAKKNPNMIFAIAGGKELSTFGTKGEVNLCNNIYYLGYINDGQIKSLIKRCEAFLFPSLYEGFGIPPLEALALGSKVIVSHSTCLPEIFSDYVNYFDPNDFNIDINNIINNYKVSDCEKLLSKYSWHNTAKFWINIFELIN